MATKYVEHNEDIIMRNISKLEFPLKQWLSFLEKIYNVDACNVMFMNGSWFIYLILWGLWINPGWRTPMKFDMIKNIAALAFLSLTFNYVEWHFTLISFKVDLLVLILIIIFIMIKSAKSYLGNRWLSLKSIYSALLLIE